jgi:hypothetical protein
MKLEDHVLSVPPVGVAGALLALVVSIGVGCVSLDKPEVVEKCATAGGCQNGAPSPDGKDAAEDLVPSDLPPGDEPAGTEEDLAGDNAVGPDAETDRPDSSINKKDASGAEPTAEASPSDPSRDGRADVPFETGSDRGSDPAVDRRPDEVAQPVDTGKTDASKEDVTKDDVAKLDVEREDVAKDDVTKLDVEGPEAPLDLASETGISNCTIFFGASPSVGTQGHPPTVGTAAACIATCDDIGGWSCANGDGRTISVNGATVSCAAAITKKNGYYVFQVGAGNNRDFAIYWWPGSGQWATSCTAPAGGF